MRLISQNGKYSVPYDNVIITRRGSTIFAESNLTPAVLKMAEYSSPERAEIEFEKLAYSGSKGDNSVFIFT